MGEMIANIKVTEPFPIFRIVNRYLLFDVNVITHIRREHNICGTLIGNIPIAAQQNVFSGIPLELMPEEARLLVDKAVAFVVDDVLAHEQMRRLDDGTRRSYIDHVEAKKIASALAARQQAELRKNAQLDKIELAKQQGLKKQRERQKAAAAAQQASKASKQRDGTSESLFDSMDTMDVTRTVDSTVPSQTASNHGGEPSLVPHDYTPTSSYPPLDALSNRTTNQRIAEATSAYHLFAHLHSQGYFLLPGLRFGCQFVAYPGDPLRYHSHFLSVSKSWDEPIDLIDIVGGGRLGTGVKKGYLVGGVETVDQNPSPDNHKAEDVRVFCFEWAAM